MTKLVCEEVAAGNTTVLNDVRTMVGDESYVPTDRTELTNRLFHTCYMGTVNSSAETRARAQSLANAVRAPSLFCGSCA